MAAIAVSAIRLRQFSYRYPDAVTRVLDHVDLSIDGGITAITGRSGCGKSTLLRVFNGLVPHFHGGTVGGRATVCGLDVLTTPTRRLAADVGFVFQDPELQAVYATVERDVAFGLENLGVARAEMRVRVSDALDSAGISHLRARAVATLSGGERQRHALASVLVMQPRVLVLDEPLSQLDAEGAASLLASLDTLGAHGTTVVIAEHRSVERADRTVSLDASGASPAHVRRAHTTPPVGSVAWQLDHVAAGAGPVPILDDVNLIGHHGEVLALVGANGSGKTTLLRTIAGLIPPHAGSVQRDDGRTAYLPQNPAALLHRPTVRDEVTWTLRHGGETDDADELIDVLGLRGVANRYPRDLSTGERQRAALAAVLTGRPGTALLDEPTRGMDESARAALCGVIERMRARGCAVVIATHDTDLVREMANRIVTLHDGAARTLDPMVAA